MSTHSSATGTVEAGSAELEDAIQDARETLAKIFCPEDDDIRIKKRLSLAWAIVHNVISQAGGPKLKNRFKDVSEFETHVRSRSTGERELVELLRSMAKQEVSWRELFDNGTLLSSFSRRAP